MNLITKFNRWILPSTAFFVPWIVRASEQISAFDDLITEMFNLIETLVKLVFALALLFFLWGLARFVASAGNPQAREGAKSIMIWGVLALFIMASVWGIVALLQGVFNVKITTIIPPEVPREK